MKIGIANRIASESRLRTQCTKVEASLEEKHTQGLLRAPKRSRAVTGYKGESTKVRLAGFWVTLDAFKKDYGDPKEFKLKVERRPIFGKVKQVVFAPWWTCKPCVRRLCLRFACVCV